MKVQAVDVFRQAENIVTRKVMDETLLVPITGELASMDNLYTLNETGAFIWQALDGSRSLAEISGMLEREYDAPAGVITADVLEIADGLAEVGLIAAAVNL
ncbi:MAG: PqqD family protein [Candidatus Electronema sp. V4]|uniref:PqqD family protein n=1 Tax=Candidatus Electronema sp. V4 TaxID=3454756 RepID=UPI00405569DB